MAFPYNHSHNNPVLRRIKKPMKKVTIVSYYGIEKRKGGIQVVLRGELAFLTESFIYLLFEALAH